MGATDSLSELHSAVRNRLLTFTDGGAGTIPSILGSSTKLYQDGPAPGAVVPYMALRVEIVGPSPDYELVRAQLFAEVMIFTGPRSNGTPVLTARRLADLTQKALTGLRIATTADGFVRFLPPRIAALPIGTDDVDREVVQIRVAADGFMYSKALAAALT